MFALSKTMITVLRERQLQLLNIYLGIISTSQHLAKQGSLRQANLRKSREAILSTGVVENLKRRGRRGLDLLSSHLLLEISTQGNKR